MNAWQTFLNEIKNQTQVFAVGPLYNRPHSPVGPTIYVDGGADFFVPDGNDPTINVGDGDSTFKVMDVQLPKDKDFSDLAFVLRELPSTIRHVELSGFLGGRRDHELFNLGETHLFLKRQNEFTSVRFDDVVVAFCGGGVSLEIQSVFSILVFEQSAITITGACEYPVTIPRVFSPVSSLGLSNRGFGTVTINSVGPCFVFLK